MLIMFGWGVAAGIVVSCASWYVVMRAYLGRLRATHRDDMARVFRLYRQNAQITPPSGYWLRDGAIYRWRDRLLSE